ncbi:MAG: cation transporter [Lachnospiraceae bacterium]|nr:cation transporter [Lachnospiraceae bacterium]
MAEKSPESRDKIIIRTSIIGIIANILLASFKAAVGLLSHSIAIVLDAVNNLSDALSSVITIVGAKLAHKLPDKQHPLGHGRTEYLSASVISFIVLYAGITSLIESVKKIIRPETADYSAVTLIVVASAVAVKLLLGTYVQKTGESVNSDSLIASGKDALFDAVISASTLFAAVLFLTTGIGVEAYLAAAISVVIIKSGIEMLSETISKIIGERADVELTRDIKQTVSGVEGVSGVYDLFIHDYGPERKLASCHVEIPDTMTADQIDELTRLIQQLVYIKHGVIMEAVGIYSINTKGDEAMQMRDEITRLVMSEEYILQMHGFYLYEKDRHVTFDVIVDFAAPDRKAVHDAIVSKVRAAYPDYSFAVAMDLDISD